MDRARRKIYILLCALCAGAWGISGVIDLVSCNLPNGGINLVICGVWIAICIMLKRKKTK